MSDVQAFAGSFVVGEVSEITLIDPDQDGDLDEFTDVKVIYNPPIGKPVQWDVKDRIFIPTNTFDGQGKVIATEFNTLILKVIPEVTSSGCLGLFLPSLPRFRKKGRIPADPGGSGVITGSLNKGSKGAAGTGVVAVGTATGRNFTLDKPLIFFGTKA